MSTSTKCANVGIFRVVLFPAWVLLLATVAGCGNSCFIGVINPPNNSGMVFISNPPPVCTLPQPKAMVKAAAHLAPACMGCSASRQVTRVHLLLSGVELHPGAVADEDSPEWQELTPELAREPQWVELREDRDSVEVTLPLQETDEISAGTYYQLRLHLARPARQQVEQVHAGSPCASVESSCVVTSDGRIHSLQTLDGNPYVRVEVASGMEVRTEKINRLRIELHAEWALQMVSGGVVDVVPVLRGHVAMDSGLETESF